MNEADFTAAPSPLGFDLLDSHLLGRPVRLQKRGDGTRLEEGLWDRGWNEPLALPASRSVAESFIIGTSGPAEIKVVGTKKESLKTFVALPRGRRGEATPALSYIWQEAERWGYSVSLSSGHLGAGNISENLLNHKTGRIANKTQNFMGFSKENTGNVPMYYR